MLELAQIEVKREIFWMKQVVPKYPYLERGDGVEGELEGGNEVHDAHRNLLIWCLIRKRP